MKKKKKTSCKIEFVNSKFMHFDQLLNESLIDPSLCSEINIHLEKMHETKQYCEKKV
jgi:hypothetical protein